MPCWKIDRFRNDYFAVEPMFDNYPRKKNDNMKSPVFGKWENDEEKTNE